MMQQLYLLRAPSNTDYGTLGHLLIPESNLVLCTLERHWADNQVDRSCILADSYDIAFTMSPSRGYKTYEVLKVKGRSGIRFDVANEVDELLGCIALGMSIVTNNNGKRVLKDSKIANEKFEKALGFKRAKLHISWANYLI